MGYKLKEDEIVAFKTCAGGKNVAEDFSERIDDEILGNIAKLALKGSKKGRTNPANVFLLDKAVDLATFISQADLGFAVSLTPLFPHKTLLKKESTSIFYEEYGQKGMGVSQSACGIIRSHFDTSGDFINKNVEQFFKQCSNNKPYFCYMRDPKRFISYVIDQAHVNGEKEVNVFNLKGLDKSEIGTWLNEEMKEKNIPCAKIVSLDSDLNEDVFMGEDEEGISVKIFTGASLKHQDLIKTMEGSAPLVGCTGDVSFTEAISLKKIPFYESCMKDKNSSITGLREAAKFFEFHDLSKILNAVPLFNDDRSAIYPVEVDLEKAVNQMAKLTDYFHKFHSVNDVIIRDINQHFLEKNHGPELEQIEKDLVNAYNEGKITPEELHRTYLEKLLEFEYLQSA